MKGRPILHGLKACLRRLFPISQRERLIALRRHVASGFTSHLQVMDELTVFYPNSYNYWRFPHLTYDNANSFPSMVLKLVTDAGILRSQVEEHSLSSFRSENGLADELSDLLSRYGSDKSSFHDYHVLYAEVLSRLGRNANLNVLEIGLGTNNPKVLSSMGAHATPGASVRAFRDYLPNSSVFGADIDTDILFREERIVTARVDQLDRASFAPMTETLGCREFDLIIDDGLHSIEANLNTLSFALGALRQGGWLVVEDIPDRTVDAWRLVGGLIADETRRCFLVTCDKANLFLVNRKS
jgi:hypothetical protein